MIAIDNKFQFGDHIEFRVWEPFSQEYSYHKGRIVGINYIKIHTKPEIAYALIEDTKWTDLEEIAQLGVDNDYDYFMKYCLDGDSTMAVAWASEDDIVGLIKD